MLNLKSKNSYYAFDEYGMLCVPSDQSWEKRSWWKKLWDKILKREWIPTWSNKSWKDSLGRTVLAKLPLKEEQEEESRKLAEALERCYRNGILYRHPDHDEVASRDHHSYFYIYRKFTNQELPDFPRMRGMNLWMKSLTGNKKAEVRYYFWAIPGALIGNWWLKKCRKWGRIGPERDNNWWIRKIAWNYAGNNGWYVQNRRTKWQKLWGRIISISIPAYALHNKAWQIYVMPDSKRKERLKQILLKRVGKSNIMLRLLFGDKTVTQQEVDSYPHLTGYRPGVYLDESCKRTIRKMDEVEAKWNAFEYDLILWLFNNGN